MRGKWAVRRQEIPYQMEGLGRVLETQQHVGEHSQRPLPHDGVPQTTEYLWVKRKLYVMDTFIQTEELFP